MFSAVLFVLSIGILYYVVKYRIHIHIEISSSPGCRRTKRGRGVAVRTGSPARERQPVASIRPLNSQETTPILDLQSALVNLQVPKSRALQVARKVHGMMPGASFDQQLRRAIQEAREAA